MKTFIVQLETHDDVISARDKISWAKARRVLLVWPRRGSVLERPVDLLLLARHARQNGAQMALVTRSGIVKTHAAELGIPVFRSASQAQQVVWRRPRGSRRGPLGYQGEERNPPDAARLREQARALALPDPFDARWLQNRWLRWAAFLLGIVAFFALALFFAPSAQVTLTPKRIIQSLTLPARADLTIRVPSASGGLPVEVIRVEVEGRDQAQATGRTRIPDDFASGEVLLTNLTDQEVTVPEGTVAMTVGEIPVRFATTRTGTVAAGVGKTLTLPVQAVLPGIRGNVSAGKIRALEGPVGLRLTVENPSPFKGGSERPGPSPSASDYQALRAKLDSALEANALEEIRALLGTDRRLVEGSLRQSKVLDETRLPEAGQPADVLQLSLRAEYEVWVVREQDLQVAATAALNAGMEEGYAPMPGSLRIEFAGVPSWQEGANRSANWNLKVERELQAEIEAPEIVDAVRGRSTAEARRILSDGLPLDAAPDITLSPPWWKMMPLLPFRITVVNR